MIERELKVSDLRPEKLVRLWKPGRPSAVFRVGKIHPDWIEFLSQNGIVHFLARRNGEQITDDDQLPMRMFGT